MGTVKIQEKETYNDGVFVGHEKKITSISSVKEKQYFKMFVEDLALIHKTTHGAKKVLFELLRAYVNRHGEIAMTLHYKKEMQKAIGFSNTKSIDIGIADLIKKGVLLRVARGTFLLNPKLFSQGTVAEIYEKEMKFCELKVIYSEKGKEVKCSVSKK